VSSADPTTTPTLCDRVQALVPCLCDFLPRLADLICCVIEAWDHPPPPPAGDQTHTEHVQGGPGLMPWQPAPGGFASPPTGSAPAAPAPAPPAPTGPQPAPPAPTGPQPAPPAPPAPRPGPHRRR
jgi:hypothetical protein